MELLEYASFGQFSLFLGQNAKYKHLLGGIKLVIKIKIDCSGSSKISIFEAVHHFFFYCDTH